MHHGLLGYVQDEEEEEKAAPPPKKQKNNEGAATPAPAADAGESSTVFVGNLSWGATEESIRKLFKVSWDLSLIVVK